MAEDDVIDNGAGQEVSSSSGGVSEAVKPWYDGVEDAETKEWLTKTNPKDLESFVKNTRELERSLGSNDRLSLPKEGENIADWDGWEKLGGKSKAEEYELQKPELPENMQWDEGFEATAKELAAKLKAPQHVVQGFMDIYAEKVKADHEALTAHDAKEKQALDQLFTEWGSEADTKKEQAKRAAMHLDMSTEEIDAIEDVVGSTKAMNFLVKAGSLLGEGGLISSETAGFMSLDGVDAEIKSLNAQIIARTETNERADVSDLISRRRALFEQKARISK